MLRSVTRFGCTLFLLVGLVLVGCEDTPSSVEDFDTQTLFDIEQTEFSIAAGQPNEPAQFEVDYQGLEDRPTLTSDADNMSIEVVEETGSPEAGETSWAVTYTGSMDEASIMETMTVSGEGDTGTVSQDIDVEINNPLVVQQESLSFVKGQSPAPRITVEYEGIEEAPTLTTEAEALDIELVEDEGNPQDGGSRSWSLEYTEETDDTSVTEMVRLESDGAATYTRDIEVQFIDAISSRTDFSSQFILIEDFETDFEVPEFTTEGGTSADLQTEESAENSIGLNALEVSAAAGDPVTLMREVSAPDLGTLTFLIKPDPTDDIDLTIVVEEEANGETVSREAGVLIEADDEWVQYEVALDALIDDFNPVAERAGGNGPLQSISFITEDDATYHLDDVMMGTSDGPQLEINDFEVTNGAYGGFSDIELDFVDTVADEAFGFTARSMSYTEGGNFFGYNFNQNETADIFLSDAGDADLVLRVGQVSETFDLLAFIEAEGDAGGYGFDEEQTFEIEASDGWQEVRIPVSELGDHPSALFDPGIENVGFELQRQEEDEDTPLELLIDDIRLDATGN